MTKEKASIYIDVITAALADMPDDDDIDLDAMVLALAAMLAATLGQADSLEAKKIWLESVTKIINDNIGVANEQLNTTI